MIDITRTTEWADLLAVTPPAPLRELFATDPGRAARYTTVAGALRADWSKNLIDDQVMQALFAVADAAGVADHRDRKSVV